MSEIIKTVDTIFELAISSEIQLIGRDRFDSIVSDVEDLTNLSDDLSFDSLRTGHVISKLQSIWNYENELFDAYKAIAMKMEMILTKYYSGKLKDTDYRKYGRVDEKLTKDQVAQYVSIHPSILEIRQSVDRIRRIIVYLEDMLKHVNYNRVKSISSSMQYNMFLAGK